MIMITDDANAKVRKGTVYTHMTGHENKDEIDNDNNTRLFKFGGETQMKIMSTHFKRKKIRKATWMA